jgi:hypothetical protein
MRVSGSRRRTLVRRTLRGMNNLEKKPTLDSLVATAHSAFATCSRHNLSSPDRFPSPTVLVLTHDLLAVSSHAGRATIRGATILTGLIALAAVGEGIAGGRRPCGRSRRRWQRSVGGRRDHRVGERGHGCRGRRRGRTRRRRTGRRRHRALCRRRGRSAAAPSGQQEHEQEHGESHVIPIVMPSERKNRMAGRARPRAGWVTLWSRCQGFQKGA